MDSATSLLKLNLSLATTPDIRFVHFGKQQTVPFKNATNGFLLQLEAALPYQSLSAVAQTALQGKRFTLSEGLLAQHVVIDACQVHGADGNVMVEAEFSGSFRGTVLFKGTPFYNEAAQQIELTGFDYELETKNLLLKGARWLFDKIILEEIKKRTVLDMKPLYKAASIKIAEAINRAWTKGVQAAGAVEELTVTHVAAQPQQLLLQFRCRGQLQLTISDLSF